MKSRPSTGFLKLVEFGMGDLSAEALILRYSERIEPPVIEAAKRRLDEFRLLES